MWARGLSGVFIILGGMFYLFPNMLGDRTFGGTMLFCGVWLFVATILDRRR